MAVEARKHIHKLVVDGGFLNFDEITTKYEPIPHPNVYRRVTIESRGINTMARYWYTEIAEIQGEDVWKHFWVPVTAIEPHNFPGAE